MNIINKPFKYQFFNAAAILIALNVFVYIIQQFVPQIMFKLTITPYFIFKGEVWRFFTYMFAHASLSHLLFNMLALYVFGLQLERYMGSLEFLLYYMLTGLLAGIFSFAVYSACGLWLSSLLGASGALFAVQLAYAVVFPRSVIYFWGLIPLRAPVMVLIFTALELFSSITGLNPGVSHLTHLTGFLFGWLYFVIRFKVNPWKRLWGR
ncbi:MAG: rhomboid family intramembrane serine protease [Spirochaetaceae bacterium]|jgi:membrane associated rhomboid family serine protease|nr:rhomboid family intramembrane serine protease [Spirochaetaceae bacterium]